MTDDLRPSTQSQAPGAWTNIRLWLLGTIVLTIVPIVLADQSRLWSYPLAFVLFLLLIEPKPMAERPTSFDLRLRRMAQDLPAILAGGVAAFVLRFFVVQPWLRDHCAMFMNDRSFS